MPCPGRPPPLQDYVVTALWERLVEVLPELAPRLEQLRINRRRYRSIADTGKTADQVVGGGWWGCVGGIPLALLLEQPGMHLQLQLQGRGSR